MAGSLLDTSVLIAAGVDAAALPDTAAISVITLGELRAGVHLARDERAASIRQARLLAVRAAFDALAIDEVVAERYGDVLAVARRERRTARATDLLIIATAAAHDRELYTRDVAQAGLAQAAALPVTHLA